MKSESVSKREITIRNTQKQILTLSAAAPLASCPPPTAATAAAAAFNGAKQRAQSRNKNNNKHSNEMLQKTLLKIKTNAASKTKDFTFAAVQQPQQQQQQQQSRQHWRLLATIHLHHCAVTACYPPRQRACSAAATLTAI